MLWPPAIALVGGWASGPISHLGVVGDVLLLMIALFSLPFTWANRLTAPLVPWGEPVRFAITIILGLAPFMLLDQWLIHLARNHEARARV